MAEKVTYFDRKSQRKMFHKAGVPWWSSAKANFVLVPIFSIMDSLVLFSIMDECLTQSALMGIVMALGIAVVLNVLPLIIAKFTHAALYKTNKHAVLMMSIFMAGFLFIYAGTVYLRFAYKDMYGEENQFIELENTVSNENMYELYEEPAYDNNKSTAVVLLLSISPLITSLLGFGIAYVSDDPIRKKVEYLEMQGIEIDEKISDIQAAITQLENTLKDGTKVDLDLDEKAMNEAIYEIGARCDILKSLARLYLAEYLANPSATSKISQEMLIESGDSVEQVNGVTEVEDNTITINKVA